MTAREVYELGRHYMRMNLRMRITSIVKPSSFVCPNLDIYSSFCKECILREILNQSLLCSMLGVGGVRLRPPGKAEVSTSSKVLACSFLNAKRRTTCNCFFTKELTGMNVRASLTLSGTAWTSLMLAVGRITVVNPALCAPNTLQQYFNYSMEEQLLCKNAEIFPDDHLVTNSTNRKHETMQRNLSSHCLVDVKREGL